MLADNTYKNDEIRDYLELDGAIAPYFHNTEYCTRIPYRKFISNFTVVLLTAEVVTVPCGATAAYYVR